MGQAQRAKQKPGHGDKPRPVNRRRVRVVCAPETCIVPGPHLLTAGENEIEAYEDDIERMRDLVESTEKLAQFSEFKRLVDEAKRQHLEEKQRQTRKSLEWHDVSTDYEGDISPYAMFYRYNRRGLLPLRAVEYIDDEVLPPKQTDAELIAQRNTEALGASIAKALREQTTDGDSVTRRNRSK